MNLLAKPGSKRSILMTAPSAARDDATLSLLAFLRWARREVTTPPRTVLLSGGALQPEFKAEGARVIDDPPSAFRAIERTMRRMRHPKVAKAALLGLHASVFRQPPQPRCIYASTIHGAGPALRFLPQGARLVVHAYETSDILDELINEAMMQRLRNGVSAWVAASDAVVEGLEARGIPMARITRCGPFIDQPAADPPAVRRALRSLNLEMGEVVVGGIGGSNWQDAPDIFIRLAALTKRRWPDLKVRFVWVGAPEDGPTRWILDHDIRNAGLDGVVTLTGDPAETQTWLSTFDVLALTSRVDPPPPAGLQAGALGVPIVAFYSRLTPEAAEIEESVGVQTVPYLDVEAMASRVADLVRDADARQTIGSRARRNILASRLTENNASALWDLLQRTAHGRVTDFEEVDR